MVLKIFQLFFFLCFLSLLVVVVGDERRRRTEGLQGRQARGQAREEESTDAPT